MNDRTAAHIEFASAFVDAVTIRPFLGDLRRMRRTARVLRSLPLRDHDVDHFAALDEPAAA